MADVPLMKVVDSPQQLPNDLLNIGLLDAISVAHGVKELASTNILTHDVEPLIVLE